MHRALITASVIAVAGLGSTGAASAASYKSCADVNTKINGKNYKLATNVQAKGITCADAKLMLISFGTGGMLRDNQLQGLKRRFKADRNQKAAMKKGRIAYTCTSANGKRSVKAWVLNG